VLRFAFQGLADNYDGAEQGEFNVNAEVAIRLPRSTMWIAPEELGYLVEDLQRQVGEIGKA